MKMVSAVVFCLSVLAGAASAQTAGPAVGATKKPPAAQAEQQKPARPSRPAGIGSDCTPSKRLPPFSMDATGNVSAKGKSIEGPVCIEVDYNPLRYRVTFASVETVTAGPDPTSVLLGGTKSSGTAGQKAVAKPELSARFSQLASTYYDQFVYDIDSERTSYVTATNAQDRAIGDIKALMNRLTGLSLKEQSGEVTRSYKEIYTVIGTANARTSDFLPADQPDRTGKNPSMLQGLRILSDNLDRLALDNPVGDTLPDKTPVNCVGDTTSNGKVLKVSWRDWYADANCKQLFDGLKKKVGDAITDMQAYASNADNVKGLRAKVAIVQYWDRLFQSVGASPDFKPIDFETTGVVRQQEPCGGIFNRNASRAVSLVTVDQLPTLDGKDPTVKAQDAFLTVTCASPVAISAGVAFSTIEQKEFAIVKSAGSTPGGPSVSKFGTLSDSSFHPMPAAFVHGRLIESDDHKVGLHATFGVSGNIQSQGSGGSSAEFLTGLSVALWRTIYITGGLHVGTRAELAGGFNEGDLVPSDITNLQGLVKRSYTVGFGFAVSFTKP